MDGDEICVAPGTYNESINFIGKAVRLYGTDGPEVTVIDGRGAGTVVKCVSGEGSETVLQGFTITGGYPESPNRTFTENGGGMENRDSNPTVTNSILWNNTGGEIDGRADVSYCDVQGGHDGVGNIDADPVCDDDGGPQAGSPCIDAANNDAVPEGITEDLDGNPSFVDDPDTEDTGHGTPPIADMGAYELKLACPGDLDGNGAVEFADLLRVLGAWGNSGGPRTSTTAAPWTLVTC